jgi:hypothetical protein
MALQNCLYVSLNCVTASRRWPISVQYDCIRTPQSGGKSRVNFAQLQSAKPKHKAISLLRKYAGSVGIAIDRVQACSDSCVVGCIMSGNPWIFRRPSLLCPQAQQLAAQPRMPLPFCTRLRLIPSREDVSRVLQRALELHTRQLLGCFGPWSFFASSG